MNLESKTDRRSFLGGMAGMAAAASLPILSARVAAAAEGGQDDWLKEVTAKRPRSKLEIMEREMETAVAKELYERAAELRDAIARLKASEASSPVTQKL